MAQKTSPYKRMKVMNQTWVGYLNINKLNPNEAYKILSITSNSTQYGPGELALIETRDGKRWRSQLPGKYLANFSKEDLDLMKNDCVKNRNPYLVYRETLIDKSYRIDIIESDENVIKNFKDGKPVPEFEISDEENSDNTTADSQKKGNVTDDKSDAGKGAPKIDQGIPVLNETDNETK